MTRITEPRAKTKILVFQLTKVLHTTASIIPGGSGIRERTRLARKVLQRMVLAWKEAEAVAVSRQDWCWSVARCIHMVTGCIKVEVL